MVNNSLRRLALALRDRARASWREAVGTDGADEDAMLFVHHRALARHMVEILALLALVALCGFVSLEPPIHRHEHVYPFYKMIDLNRRMGLMRVEMPRLVEYHLLRFDGVVAPLLATVAGLLVLMRAIRIPALLGAALLLWPPLVLAVFCRFSAFPAWIELHRNWQPQFGPMPIPVPMHFAMLPPLALLLAAVAGAIIATRRSFSRRRAAAGAAVSALLVHVVLHRAASDVASWHCLLALALLVAVAVAFVSMPGQRRATARFVGSGEGDARAATPRTRSFADALGVHAAMAGFALLVAAAVGIATLHKSIIERAYGHAKPRTHAPGEVNAAAFFGPEVGINWSEWDGEGIPDWWNVRGRAPAADLAGQLPKNEVVDLLRYASYMHPDDEARFSAEIPRAEEDAAFAALEPGLSQMSRAAREADYYEPVEVAGELIGIRFTVFRDNARLLAARAGLRANRGDVDGALFDIETVFRMAAVLGESRYGLVPPMIGCALRNIATESVESCHAAWFDDPSSLARLGAALDDLADEAAPPMDIEGLMRGQYGDALLAYPFEIVQPVYSKALKTWDSNRDHYRRVQIAVAITRFHLDRGAWPSSVSQMVPEYLVREPLNPSTGMSYVLVGDGTAPPEIRYADVGRLHDIGLQSYPAPSTGSSLADGLADRARAAARQ